MTKHVGIVACSAEGAALCHRILCREAESELGPDAHPRITMDSIPLARWMPAFKSGDYRAVGTLMVESARVLADAGADFALCPDNSAHRAWDCVASASSIPWLHIAHEVAREARRSGYRRVGLLGTLFTTERPVYGDAFRAADIETIAPGRADAALVDQLIFDELVRGIVTEMCRTELSRVIDRLRVRECDAVALACTELPLVITGESSPLPTLDSTAILARAALRKALGDRAPGEGWSDGSQGAE